MFRALTPAQSREFIDSAQAFETLMATQMKRASYAGGMHWKTVGESDYLYKTKGGRGAARSLGPRSEETERIYAEFQRGKATSEERYKGLLAAVQERARFCKAARINRVPGVVTAVLREIELAGLLGGRLYVVGTNALYAYEAAAACQFDTSLLATADMDLLWDSRAKLDVVDARGRMRGLMDVLRKADRSFEAIRKDGFRAANKEGYLIDLIQPARSPPWRGQESRMSPSDELVAAEISGLDWLESSPRFAHVVIGDDGIPATMITVDPRAFAVHKLWLSQQTSREAVKRDRDRLQALAVAKLVAERLPHLPFERRQFKAFPQEVVEAARPQLADANWQD